MFVIKLQSHLYSEYVLRNSHDFTDINALNTLYFSLVRSIIEYASFVRYPHQLTFIERLNKINNKYTRISLFRCGGTVTFKSFVERQENLISRLFTTYCTSWLTLLIRYDVSSFSLRHQFTFNNNSTSLILSSQVPLTELCAVLIICLMLIYFLIL